MKPLKIPAPRTAIVVGRRANIVARMLEANGFRITSNRPQLVVTFGGDGTILHSERLYPGVPKLCLRNRNACFKCTRTKGSKNGGKKSRRMMCIKCGEAAIKKIAASKTIRVKLERKLEATARTKDRRDNNPPLAKMLALNEAQVRNKSPLHALRGTVETGGKRIAFIGDGVIVATPYGATGYFRAACGKTFKRGLGVAFNNPTQRLKPLLLKENEAVRITVTRRNGVFACDNNPATATLAEGSTVTVRNGNRFAKFVVA
ncbi:MAG: hypothetical protein AABW54_02775 [Candidatus Micrarchaeota archaeon]